MDELDGAARLLAWKMPQTAGDGARLSSYVVSVDEIEAATGLDLLSLLDDVAEEALESVKASRMW